MLSLPASKGFEIGSGFAGKNFFGTKLVVVEIAPALQLA
jgi:chorismate synthase